MKISIYDPKVKAYREISIDDYKKQLESLGLDKKEVGEKIEKVLKPKIKELKEVGVSEKEIDKIIKEQTK